MLVKYISQNHSRNQMNWQIFKVFRTVLVTLKHRICYISLCHSYVQIEHIKYTFSPHGSHTLQNFFKVPTNLYLTESLLFLQYKSLKGMSSLVALIFLYHGSLLCPVMEDFFFFLQMPHPESRHHSFCYGQVLLFQSLTTHGESTVPNTFMYLLYYPIFCGLDKL